MHFVCGVRIVLILFLLFMVTIVFISFILFIVIVTIVFIFFLLFVVTIVFILFFTKISLCVERNSVPWPVNISIRNNCFVLQKELFSLSDGKQ